MIIKQAVRHLLHLRMFGLLVKYFWWVIVRVLPLKKIMETNELLVLEHPDPSYEFHLLILPRQVIRDFSEVQPDSQYWLSLPGVVSQLVQQFHLEGRGYRLITNTGQYQDIPQLHFHLVSGESLP